MADDTFQDDQVSVAERLADAEYACGAAAVAFVFDRTVAMRFIQAQSPGSTGVSDRDRLCRVRGMPAIALARIGAQTAAVRIPIRNSHEHELA